MHLQRLRLSVSAIALHLECTLKGIKPTYVGYFAGRSSSPVWVDNLECWQMAVNGDFQPVYGIGKYLANGNGHTATVTINHQ